MNVITKKTIKNFLIIWWIYIVASIFLIFYFWEFSLEYLFLPILLNFNVIFLLFFQEEINIVFKIIFLLNPIVTFLIVFFYTKKTYNFNKNISVIISIIIPIIWLIISTYILRYLILASI